MTVHAIAPLPRPDIGFYRSPSIDAKAAETALISILALLVQKGVLSEAEAIGAFNNVELLQGVDQALPVGSILACWKATLAWLLNRNRPSAA
jgi:hypothetical protein